MADTSISVFVAARHDAIRAALWSLLQAEADIDPLAATATGADLARLLASLSPTVVVADESVLGDDGIAWLPALLEASPRSAFVVVGMHDHPAYVARAREAGAADYVLLDEADRLGRAVVEAGDWATPFAAGPRRTGSRPPSMEPRSTTPAPTH